MTPIIGLFSLSPMEIMIILGIGVLLFGRKLPEVGRYLGKGIVEFKKGMKGMEDDMDAGAAMSPRTDALPMQPSAAPPPQRVTTSVPKFDDGSITRPPQG